MLCDAHASGGNSLCAVKIVRWMIISSFVPVLPVSSRRSHRVVIAKRADSILNQSPTDWFMIS